MNVAKIFLFVMVAPVAGANAQTAQDSVGKTRPATVGLPPLERLGKDLCIQASSPFHMSRNNAYWVCAGVVTTAALLLTDQGTYNTVKDAEFDATWARKASPVITEFGSNYGLGVVGAWAVYGLVSHNSKAMETAYLASEAFVTSGIWGVAIKWVTSRERPSASTETGGEWSGPCAYFWKGRHQSIASFDAFPSGHMLTAVSIATVFAKQYADNIVVPIVCYTAASLVGISRITEDAHWASDVFVGAVLGYLSAQEVLANNPSEVFRRTDGSPTVRVGWSLGVAHGTPTVQVQLQF